MTLRFLVDVNLSPKLCLALKAAGLEAAHAVPLGLGAATDRALAEAAIGRGAVLVTRDTDFLRLALADARLRLLWLRVPNPSHREVWSKLEPRLPEITAAFEAGERIVEFR